MKLFRFTALVIFTLALTSLANAQASRTWVSGVGDDANPCSRTAPCKTFAGAISKTAACGEIDALDPGGFGAVTITKSITIDGSGTFASILASLTTGVIINALSTDVITLRGISINGFCNGVHGINILSAKTVNVEDCVIFRFNTGNGITSTDSTGVNLNVRNSVIRDNTLDGINMTTGTGSFNNVTLDNVRLSGNANGLHARSGTKVTAHNSVFSNNTTNGIFVDAAGSTFASVRVWNSDISLNGTGLRAGNAGNLGGSGAEIGQNQINFNSGNGVTIGTGGVVETFTNNSIRGNGTDGCAGCTGVGPGS